MFVPDEFVLRGVILMTVVAATACRQNGKQGSGVPITPAQMRRVATVDERYQSYNIEMLEVTGGKFWRAYGPELEQLLKQPPPANASSIETPAGMNPALYEYRPPLDLTNSRLRKLAAALSPVYVRISGTWANTTYFPDTEKAPAEVPTGFMGVLTHAQWRGVVDYSNAVNAKIVTSFATSAGTRDKRGVWTDRLAKRFIDYTRSMGGRIAAAEFMNEPNLAAMGGAPTGYDAATYGRDFNVFRTFVKQAAPEMILLGPGSVGETTGDWALAYGNPSVLNTRDLLAAAGPGVDAVSYHHYGAVSRRCSAMGNQTTAEAALSELWLGRTDETLDFYKRLRDEFEPGKPFWNTETADAACGGNPWGGTFVDTFRYLDQLGRLAKQDVRVVIHNTLVASDYGLLDDKTFTPKPNYWGALLWRKFMGTTVLDSGVPVGPGLHVYAHCLRGAPGGVALLAINTDRTAPRRLALPLDGERYTLTSGSDDLQSKTVRINGTPLALGADGESPAVEAVRAPARDAVLPAASISFLNFGSANNVACR
jgi:heparanase 1